jgi:hypothetical protein
MNQYTHEVDFLRHEVERCHASMHSQVETLKLLMEAHLELKKKVERPWVGLTNEELDHAAEQSDNYASFIAGALFAQDKLKEKNDG